MKYDIIIFDIGGTLFDKRISNTADVRVISEICTLRKSGIKVGVCTMRSVRHCQEVVPTTLDFFISLNGSYIVCDNNVIYDSPMEKIISAKDMLSYDNDSSYYSTDKAYYLAMKNGFLADKLGIADRPYNVTLFDMTEKDLDSYNDFNYDYWSTTGTAVFQNKQDSKVIGIKRVLDYYSLGERILYFGDGPNDLEIFKNYRDCICMGSCYPELEQHALFKTETCQNNGISVALRKLGIV